MNSGKVCRSAPRHGYAGQFTKCTQIVLLTLKSGKVSVGAIAKAKSLGGIQSGAADQNRTKTLLINGSRAIAQKDFGSKLL